MNQGLVMMRLTLAAFLLAVVVAAFTTAWAAGRSVEGFMATQQQAPTAKLSGSTGEAAAASGPQPDKGLSTQHGVLALALAGALGVAGLASAVYGLTLKAGERGKLASGVAALRASKYIAAGGALIGAGLIAYAVSARQLVVAVLGGAVTLLNLYVVARARSGAKAFEEMLLGA